MNRKTARVRLLIAALLMLSCAQSCNPKKMLPTGPIIDIPKTPALTQLTTMTRTKTPTASAVLTPQSPTASPTISVTPTLTPFVSPTISPTVTCTSTYTPVVPKGVASLSPSWAVMNSTGITWQLVYNAGSITWAAAPLYGTLSVTIPAGFSAPSLSAADPGYFTVSVTNGTLYSVTVNAMQIIIQVRNLTAATGTITVNYGDKSGGGPGAAAAANAGIFTFTVGMTESGDTTSPIASSPALDIVAPLGSAAISPQIASTGFGGNTAVITYTPQTLWGSGTLEIIVPGGFSQPSLNPGDPGYFTVSVSGGSLTQVSTQSMEIIVSASAVPNDTGRIIVTYGAMSGGGPGFNAPSAAGSYTFAVESDNNGSNVHPIAVSPVFQVSQATSTVTRTFTFTPTYTATATITLTSTISKTFTVSPTVTKTSVASNTITPTRTMSKTVTCTFTISPTVTVTSTRTVSPTASITRTITQTFTVTLTKTVTGTCTESPTFTSTRTMTDTKTVTPTRTETFTATPSVTPTFTITPTFTPHEVDFPDANLNAAVRTAIGKPAGTIYNTDLYGLTTLNAFSSGIADLSGLDQCPALTILSLYNNSITSLTPLAGLLSLNYLDVNTNQITDVSPLVTNVNSGGLAGGAQVILNNNPLGSQALNTDIPYLQSKGVVVTFTVSN